jgi:hypothetical protein
MVMACGPTAAPPRTTTTTLLTTEPKPTTTPVPPPAAPARADAPPDREVARWIARLDDSRASDKRALGELALEARLLRIYFAPAAARP